MAVKCTIVHGNNEAQEEVFLTQAGAMAWAVVQENQWHGTVNKPLSSFFDWVAKDRSQFGTGYHYVMFEEA